MSAMTDLAPARLRLGIALTAVAACSYGSLPTFVRLAYAGGANETGVMLFRSFAALLVGVAMGLATGKPVIPPRNLRWVAVAIGFIWLIGSYSYIASIRRIPIGLAVTIFYLFPLMVALMARLWERERLPVHRILALSAGFGGVCMAVGVSLGRIDLVGVALAGLAALSVSSNIILSARVMRHSSQYAAIVMMTGTAAVTLVVLSPAIGCRLPGTGMGWFGLLAGTAMLCVAMSCFYSAVSVIGTVRAALIGNLEPIVATGLAYVVLGEALGPAQFAGVALVIGAILAMQIGDRRARN